jgi:hypothetical protein
VHCVPDPDYIDDGIFRYSGEFLHSETSQEHYRLGFQVDEMIGILDQTSGSENSCSFPVQVEGGGGALKY